eukprot:jgi/Astpho2/3111/fgenesh1_pg.00051_%23_83_t
MRDAVAQRIAQAKLYKKGSAAQAQQGPSLLDRINGEADASAAGPSGNHPASGQDPVTKLTAYGQQLAEQEAATLQAALQQVSEQLPQGEQEGEQPAGGADGDEVTCAPLDPAQSSGSAQQAAGFLQQAVREEASKEQRLQRELSPEQYSLWKEKQMKAQRAEIISVDKNYSADKSVMDPDYKPKVATWGVFKRPSNISEHYGGGRTIPAGTKLETEEQAAARKARMAAVLLRYKEQSGTEVDPAAAAQAQLEYDKGQQLFDNKDLAAALPLFAAAAVLVPARSGIGGKARLQQAICLDSLARGLEESGMPS